MPERIFVSLTPDGRAELERRARERVVAPRLRDRLEMVRLSDSGRTTSQIAQDLSLHIQTVRKYVNAFLSNGWEALEDRPRSGRPVKLREEHLASLEQLLERSADEGKAWTVPQLVEWLERNCRVRISRSRLTVHLKERGFRWTRTTQWLKPMREDLDLQARKRAALEILHFRRELPQRDSSASVR